MSLFLAALASLGLKSTLLLLVGCTLSAAAVRATAATRHLLWSLTVAAALALPFAMATLPALNINPPARPVPVAILPALSVSSAPAIAPALAMPLRVEPFPAAPTSASAAPEPPRYHLNPLLLLAALWLVGALLFFLKLGIDALSAARMARKAAAAGPLDAAECRHLAAALRIHRPFRLVTTPQVAIPQAAGIFRASIYLPVDSAAWTAERRQVVLLHELAHVRRGDCLWLLLARMACAIYWFNPLVWIAARRLRLESEQASDNEVLTAALDAPIEPADYAAHLLAIARELLPGAAPSPLAAAMLHGSQLESRLGAILDATRRRRRPGALIVTAIGALAAATLAPLAAARMAPPKPPLQRELSGAAEIKTPAPPSAEPNRFLVAPPGILVPAAAISFSAPGTQTPTDPGAPQNGAKTSQQDGADAPSAILPSSPAPGQAVAGARIVSDTAGVDFSGYLQQILDTIRQNWYAAMPKKVYSGAAGLARVSFTINKNGSIAGTAVTAQTGDPDLDAATLAAITKSSPFPPLPAAFTGPSIKLEFGFFYNRNPDATPQSGTQAVSVALPNTTPIATYGVNDAWQPKSATGDPVLGNPNATNHVVIYQDLQCPACAAYCSEVLTALVPKYGGQVAFEFRDFPIPAHRWAFDLAVLARYFDTKSPDAGFAWRTYAFQHAGEWADSSLLSDAVAFAAKAGIPADDLPQALTRQDLVAAVSADRDRGAADHVAYTPFVIVNGRPLPPSATPADLDAALAAIQATSLSQSPRPATAAVRQFAPSNTTIFAVGAAASVGITGCVQSRQQGGRQAFEIVSNQPVEIGLMQEMADADGTRYEMIIPGGGGSVQAKSPFTLLRPSPSVAGIALAPYVGHWVTVYGKYADTPPDDELILDVTLVTPRASACEGNGG